MSPSCAHSDLSESDASGGGGGGFSLGDNHQRWLRYLIHLRFASSRSGKIYLHTDMRMIVFRKSDADTAADMHGEKSGGGGGGAGFEMRSFTRGPSNPKFSPRK